MSRIQLLERDKTKEEFAYSTRSDGNKFTLHSFERVGGCRELVYCEWNIDYINTLSGKEFKTELQLIKASSKLKKFYAGMTLTEFFNYIST